MDLTSFERVPLAHLPTPLEPLERLSQHLDGPRIFVKRDDATGLALGGNKVRKLEFLLAEARRAGADTLVTVGGLQSNHARQTAAAAARLGLACELILPRYVDWPDPVYATSGNVLLNRLLGARMHVLPEATLEPNRLEQILADIQRRGGRPFYIPIGGSTPVGALGYVNAIAELLPQLDQLGVSDAEFCVATGSAGTHAGIVVGLAAAGRANRVTGVAVSGDAPQKELLVRELAAATAEILGLAIANWQDRVRVLDAYVGPGYGLPTPSMVEAIQLVARLEGLLLDPVYTGKAMAGLLDLIRRSEINRGAAVVFWHTGGTPALFAYPLTVVEASNRGAP
jgi:D-cysteine desulfhydrase family pyridoxal phosphate-dependent enzyme